MTPSRSQLFMVGPTRPCVSQPCHEHIAFPWFGEYSPGSEVPARSGSRLHGLVASIAGRSVDTTLAHDMGDSSTGAVRRASAKIDGRKDGTTEVSVETLQYVEKCRVEGLIPCGWTGPSGYKYDEGDTPPVVLMNLIRLICLILWLVLCCCLTIILLLPATPFGLARRQALANYFGHAFGWGVVRILGTPYRVAGQEYAGYGKRRPVLYLSNHCSVLDVILCMWQVPLYTVGIGKKEIVYVPVFGWLYYLAGHYRIDRKNRKSAIESLNKAADWMVEKQLSMMLYPEGTRSTTGHLAHFKKGFAHMALRTGLPIVPIVLTGTHKAWKNHTTRFRAAPLSITFLPPIDTTGWTVEKLDLHIKEVEYIFNEALPQDQKML